MPMTVLVTRNAPMRYRGFLASCMLELAAGVYTSPRMTRAVRERVIEGQRHRLAHFGVERIEQRLLETLARVPPRLAS